MGTTKKTKTKGPHKGTKAAPAGATKKPPGRIPPPGPKQKAVTEDGEQTRALSDAREQIRLLIDDRDEQVAIAEAAEMEREALERELAEARERIEALEKQIPEGSSSPASPGGEGEEASVSFDEEEEEEPSPSEDLDDVESIYERMDDPRVRRQELDRERIDRETQAGDESYWRVCPKCGDSLDEVESEDVKIDRCENCGGIYLDHGEVEMLLSIARGRHGLRRVRSSLVI
jgi:hypothetical protein